ncbi:MAG: HEAT repeat domain-containing protein [Planctomycetes bacterium]|nr:HEAT repeat domain-containing protein [Planctomycetota bacterium]
MSSARAIAVAALLALIAGDLALASSLHRIRRDERALEQELAALPGPKPAGAGSRPSAATVHGPAKGERRGSEADLPESPPEMRSLALADLFPFLEVSYNADRALLELDARNPDEVAAAIAAAWDSLPPESRRKLLRHQSWLRPPDPHIFELLDRCMRDSDPSVRGEAMFQTKEWSLQDFTGHPEAYEAWWKLVRDKPFDAALAASAGAFVEWWKRDEERNFNDRSARDLLCHNCPVVGRLGEAGFLAVLEPRLTGGSLEDRNHAAYMLSYLQADEAYLRRTALPLLSSAETRECGMMALGQPGNSWAIDLMRPFLKDPDESIVFAAASCLADIEDRRVIPELIEAMKSMKDREKAESIGEYALSGLTGLTWHKSHNAAWWEAWWAKEQQKAK